MNLDQYFLALSFGYLKATPEKAKNLSAFLKNLPYEFEHPKTVGKYSLAGDGPDHNVVGFLEWANRLRLEGILSMSVESINRTEMADHISAGFMNGISEIITIQTKNKTHAYALVAFNSPTTEASARELIQILNAQTDAEKVKDYVYEELTEYLKLNQVPYDTQASLEELLLTHETRYWDTFSSRLIQEAQIEVAVLGNRFIIPSGLREYLHRFDRDPVLEESPPEDNSVYFYAVAPVTADQIAQLVEFQTNSELIRKQAQVHLGMYGMNLSINFAAEDWKQQLGSLSDEDLKTAESILSRSIADDCQKNGTLPLVPEDQADLWGPSEEERKRIKLRGKIQMGGFYFTANKNPWSLYCFKEVPPQSQNMVAEPVYRDSVSEARDKYQQSLERIYRFSEKTKTPFTEAFKAGLFFLKNDIPTISFHSSEGVTVLKEFLNMNGYSEKAQDIIAGKAELFEDLRQVQEDPLEFRCWCSFEITSVFGGMGSWNDLGFGSADEIQEYDEVTKDFYKARNNLYLSLFNY